MTKESFSVLPAHERQRRDLDGAALDQLPRPVEVHHVVERVVERPEIGVHLLREVAGQEAELLARLDRRTREHDAREGVLHQLGDGHRHRQIRLPGPGRTDAEDDVEVPDGVDVGFLVDALRRDDALVRGDEDGVEEDVLQARRAIAGEDAERVLHVGGVDRVALLEEAVELRQRAAGQLARDRVAVDGERPVAHVDAHAELALEELHVLVVLAEQLPEQGLVPELERDGGDGWLAQDDWSLPAPSSS